MTLVKICGLTRPEDVDAAVAAGADLVGFVLRRGHARATSSPTAPARCAARVPTACGRWRCVAG